MNDKVIKSLVYDHLRSVAPVAALLYKIATKADQLPSQMPKLEHILSSAVVMDSFFGNNFSLPDCVVAEIFSNLNLKERIAVQRVCKQWHSLATENVNSVEFYGYRVEDSEWRERIEAYNIVEKMAIVVRNWAEVYSVMKMLKQLKHVKFCECNFKMGDDFVKVCDLLKEIESIRIHYSCDYISGENIKQMLNGCFNLRELAVHHNPLYYQSPKLDYFLISIIRQNQHINSLWLQSIPNLKNCSSLIPALKRLDLFHCKRHQIHHVHLVYFLQNVLYQSEESLEILYIPAIREQHLRIISRFKNLKDLRIQRIEEDSFWSEYFQFQNLEILGVGYIEKLGAEQLVKVIRENRKLRVLKLGESPASNSINEWVIEQIVEHCNHLQSLILRSNPKFINDNMLLNLLKLPKLEMLYFPSTTCGFTLNALNTLINNHSSLRVVSCPTNYANEVLQNLVEVKQFMPNYSKSKTYFVDFHASEPTEMLPNNIFSLKSSKYSSFFSGFCKYGSFGNKIFIDYFDWKKIPILNRKREKIDLCNRSFLKRFQNHIKKYTS